ncbi:MAG: large conductance mechanosensitive channel protein MscL [Oscillospiraceae bacterium]|jgi:large conductance mechanosensitive channel
MENSGRKGFFGEFKEFISRGSVIDLAVGVIIGGAFSSITNSLVNDVIMPIVSMFIGGINFDSWQIVLPNLFGTVQEEPNTINIGLFIATVINFLILALVIFLLIRGINRVMARMEAQKKAEEEKAEEAPPAEPAPTAEQLLAEILAELRKD